MHPSDGAFDCHYIRDLSPEIQALTMYCRVAATQPEVRSLAAPEASTERPVMDESGPDQCHALVASNACQDVPPATQQEDTTRYNRNTTIAGGTSMSALTKDRIEFNDFHYDHNAAFCHDLSKAIDLQQAGLELNFALPIHCYMPDKSQFDQWIEIMAK